MIYLDAGATTFQKPETVYSAVNKAMRTCSSPGRGGYATAQNAEEILYACRVQAGKLFEAEPSNVVFTMNATHALNIAIKSIAEPGDEVVLSGFEHNAVVRPLVQLGANLKIAGTKLFDPEDTLHSFSQCITGKTKLVVCTHVSNVFGYRLPIEAIAELCRTRHVPLVVDASQSAGILPVSMKALSAAFICMPGHKGLYGPQGSGLLLCGAPVNPLLTGGSGSNSFSPTMPEELPDRAEAGTHNVPAIAGLLEGLRFLEKTGVGRIAAHEAALCRELCEKLMQTGRYKLFSGSDQTGTVSLLPLYESCQNFADRLSSHGIAVRAGLHCAPRAHSSAGTLTTGTVRFSFSWFNTPEEIQTTVMTAES